MQNDLFCIKFVYEGDSGMQYCIMFILQFSPARNHMVGERAVVYTSFHTNFGFQPFSNHRLALVSKLFYIFITVNICNMPDSKWPFKEYPDLLSLFKYFCRITL
jgi:hypothetical protein